MAADKLAKTSTADQMARLAELNTQIVTAAAETIDAVLAFADYDFENMDEPSAELIAQYGADAGKRFRIAKASWMSAKEAPAALKIAAQIATAGMKAQAIKSALQPLNITFTQVIVPPSPEKAECFEARVVESEED